MLDKAIAHGKEHRKQYYKSKAVDKTCRCHGGCLICYANRMHKTIKAQNKADYMEEEDECER